MDTTSSMADMSKVDFLQHIENLANRVEAALNPLQQSQEELKKDLVLVNEKVSIVEHYLATTNQALIHFSYKLMLSAVILLK